MATKLHCLMLHRMILTFYSPFIKNKQSTCINIINRQVDYVKILLYSQTIYNNCTSENHGLKETYYGKTSTSRPMAS